MRPRTKITDADRIALSMAHATLAMASAQHGSSKVPLSHTMAQVCILVAEGDLDGAIARLTSAAKE